MFDVSIIIPVYKAKYTIKKTLESINNQKFKNKIPKIELILSIDDNKNYEKYRSILNNEIINTKSVSTKYPCSFHPFMQRSQFKEYKHFPSQDIYNLTEHLSEKKIKIIKKAYYKLNLRKNSLTMKRGFKHKIKLAYKKYLIKGIKDRNNKISRHFAERLILNKNFEVWKKLNNSKKSYYEYLGDVYGE